MKEVIQISTSLFRLFDSQTLPPFPVIELFMGRESSGRSKRFSPSMATIGT